MKPKKVLRNILKLFVVPHKVFKNIRSTDEIAPLFSIPIVFVLRYLHVALHEFLVHPAKVSYAYDSWIEFMATKFHLGQNLMAVFYFLLLSISLYAVSRLKNSDISYTAVETGVFYCVIGSMVTLVFDIPHWFFPDLTCYVWGWCFHISIVLNVVLLPLWLSLLSKRSFEFESNWLLVPLFFAFMSIPLYLKYIHLPSPLEIGLITLVFFNLFYIKEKFYGRAAFVTLLIISGFLIFLGFTPPIK